ncbi:MAG: hypothetical protein M3O50_00150 [Myxococcota bacterium]|nr:hypothetical protein [Myxococcota bacterium]
MPTDGRPSFARDFPRVPAIDELVDAFARGDYRSVRTHAPRFVVAAEPQDVQDAARQLLERTRPDPLAVALLAMTGALLALLTAYWVVHGTPPPAAERGAGRTGRSSAPSSD